MDRRGSAGEDGFSSETAPPVRRRLSMEEDMLYQHIMTTSPRRPSHPPPYQPTGISPPQDLEHGKGKIDDSNAGRKGTTVKQGQKVDGRKSQGETKRHAMLDTGRDNPGGGGYAVSVFHKKHEIENTTKRAEDRRWHTTFVTLNGTALSIYNVKKDWGWGKSRDGPTICPDNPPWVRKAKLEKTYSLLHADAGIAADYKKRRYVIRIRAETDQFLLSCIELTTFIKWLEYLFAAIDVAAPIDDRDFPRDMSIPRIQRVRWFRNQTGAVVPTTMPESHQESQQDAEAPVADPSDRRDSSPHPLPTPTPAPPRPRPDQASQASHEVPMLHPRLDHAQLMSTMSNPNPAVDPHTGKWFPENQWTTAHDLLYAKLCYSNLLFRSPRKSNYIISKGKQWFVDWGTGRMVRVLPPTYGEVDYFGPWQVIHTENRRL
ncbi:hypothetical protein PT974_08252 [Cladobotryum mycophilum]|uniref:PH domain-containing protein n=1 Tax=Cladobotryum mycophilum TaxID=491253 RepID=A0ABR0SDE1_9HYPO